MRLYPADRGLQQYAVSDVPESKKRSTYRHPRPTRRYSTTSWSYSGVGSPVRRDGRNVRLLVVYVDGSSRVPGSAGPTLEGQLNGPLR